MGSNSLQPELMEELKTLKLDDDFLDQIKDTYCDRLQVRYKLIYVVLNINTYINSIYVVLYII